MRKRAMSASEAKAMITGFVGIPLRVSVNKGRKRIVRYDAAVTAVYPSVFTLSIENDRNLNSLSCSYSDVICGDIKLIPRA